MEEFLTHGLTQLISAVGFPIVVAVALYYQNNTLSSSYQKLTRELQDKIDNNTLVLTRLVEKLNQDVLLNEPTDTEKGDTK